MITKNDLVLSAYEELKISGLTEIPSKEEIVLAIKKMDSMIYSWANSGISINYNKSDGYDSVSPSQDSGVSDENSLAVILNLAKNLAPSFGIALNPETRFSAKKAYNDLFSKTLTEREKDPYQPVGSGKNYGSDGYYAQRFQSPSKDEQGQ